MGYAASGAMAAVAAFIIQLLFRFVQDGLAAISEAGKFTKALSTNLDRWPWFFMTFFTTVAIAWAADNYFLSRKEPKWLRAAETVGVGIVFGLLQWIVLEFFRYLPEAARWDVPGKREQMIITSALVGACIGFFVPSCYRRGCRRDLETEPVPHLLPATALLPPS
jgi:UDP-N-acetylmuramyl pentapeptide phosphotransferase/UDP-N-acetylglucosamine-1-phosphate transferase